LEKIVRLSVLSLVATGLLVAAGCKSKQVAKVTPTAPPLTSPAPTARITATPGTVTAGDKVVLSWSSTDASSISIDGLGTVSSSGTKTVTPSASTTYHLVARGDGGSAEANANVTVHSPVAIAQPASTMSAEEEFKASIRDVFFDYDKANLRSDAQSVLPRDAAFLASHPNLKVLIGGYCDERGSNEYNISLGQDRAESVKEALVSAGVSASRLRVVSFGKEKPFCSDETDSCWQQNRRAGFTLDR
jgi:peptidoglycan-associated lipoprotein